VDAAATVTVEVDLGTAQPGQCLCFRLGGVEYAIDILQVHEIRGW
jgi:chemotaxis signal transduction protein